VISSNYASCCNTGNANHVADADDADDAIDATIADLRVHAGHPPLAHPDTPPTWNSNSNSNFTHLLSYGFSKTGKRKREQHCKLCYQVIPGGDLARHEKTWHPKAEGTVKHKYKYNGEANLPQRASEWLDSCGVDLSTSGVPWPLDKLDQLPDLCAQPMASHDQCIA
jgi:hypothetical protein